MRDEAPRAVTAICRALEEQIEHGLLPSGSQLPAERKLSEVFDTTRITLREALVQLWKWVGGRCFWQGVTLCLEYVAFGLFPRFLRGLVHPLRKRNHGQPPCCVQLQSFFC